MKFKQIPADHATEHKTLNAHSPRGCGGRRATKDQKQMSPSPSFLVLTYLSRAGPHPAGTWSQKLWPPPETTQIGVSAGDPGHQYYQLPRWLQKAASMGTQCPVWKAAQTQAAAEYSGLLPRGRKFLVSGGDAGLHFSLPAADMLLSLLHEEMPDQENP